MRTFYFSLDFKQMDFLCQDITPDSYVPGGAQLVCGFVQYLYCLAH